MYPKFFFVSRAIVKSWEAEMPIRGGQICRSRTALAEILFMIEKIEKAARLRISHR